MEPMEDDSGVPAKRDPRKLTLDDCTREYERYQSQKSRKDGGVEARVLVNLFHYMGEQHAFHRGNRIVTSPRDKNKPKLPINILKKRIDKVIGKLSSVDPAFDAMPEDSSSSEKVLQSEAAEHLDRALDERLREVLLRRKRWFWKVHGGVAFEVTGYRPDVVVEPRIKIVDGETIWKDNETDQELPESEVDRLTQAGVPIERFDVVEELDLQGDIETEILGPLNVFLPESAESIRKLAPDQSVMVAKIRTRQWIEDNYPTADLGEIDEAPDEFRIVKTDISHVGDSLSGHNIGGLIPIVQGSRSKDDPPMYIVIDRYQPVSATLPRFWSNPDEVMHPLAWGGRLTTFVPGVTILSDGELPFRDGIPIEDYHWDVVTTTFWTGGLTEHMIPAQKGYNKHIADLRQIANAYIKNKLLKAAGLDIDEFDPDSTHPVEGGINEAGQKMLAFMDVPQVPQWFVGMTETLKDSITEMAGGTDLFDQKAFPGQLRGSMAIPMLLEMSDSEWWPILQEYGDTLARVKQQRLNRVKQFWPPRRTLHYFSKRGERKVFEFHKSEILPPDVEYNISVVRSSLLPELESMREARINERLSGPMAVLYQDDRTGAWDKESIAAELRFGTHGREAKILEQRKFAGAIVEAILKVKAVPPVLPLQPHAVILDELESVINSMDFFTYSPPVQQQLISRAQEHMGFLQEQAQQQQAAMEQQGIEAAVNQAAQQAAARAGAEAVDAVKDQLREIVSMLARNSMQGMNPMDFLTTPDAPTPGGTA